MDLILPGVFVMIWGALMLGTLGGWIIGIAAIVSAAQLPAEAFGPWWDNTKTAWVIGLVVSFMVPFGTLVAGAYWFFSGRAALRTTGMVARPFWVGPAKPGPVAMPPPYSSSPYSSPLLPASSWCASAVRSPAELAAPVLRWVRGERLVVGGWPRSLVATTG